MDREVLDMPFIRNRRGIAALAVTGAVAGALAVTGSANAHSLDGGPCMLPATSQVFSQFGDTNNYYLAGGGDFEYGLNSLLSMRHVAAWTGNLSASVVAGSEPYELAGRGDDTATRLRSGGKVVSTPFCVSADQPHLRLVAKSLSGGNLRVTVSTVGWTGGFRSTTTVVPAAEHAAWAPTRYVPLNTTGMPADERGLATVTIESTDGTWLVDDVFVDPYAK
jgi:hypothetical protein